MPDIAGQRYVVIERARGYSSGFSKIYDERRFVNGIIYLLGSGRGTVIIIPDDDVIGSYTLSAITTPTSGTFPSCITDRDDSTSCSWSVSASSSTDTVRLDLGSSSVVVILRIYDTNNAGTSQYVYLYGSNDGTTWTQVASWLRSGGIYSETFVYASGYRYYKITASNGTATTITYYLASFEAYPIYTLSQLRIFSNVSKRVAVFVYGAYYQLLEVVTGV